MGKEVRDAILQLIEKDRKIHKSTEARLDRKKNTTEVYKQLSIQYDRDIGNMEIKDKELLEEYGLLDKDNLIEYIRYKYIAMKIDIIGINNPKNSLDFFNYLSKEEDKELQKDFKFEKSIGYEEGVGSKILYTFKTINISNQAKSDIINDMLNSLTQGGHIAAYIDSVIDKFNIQEDLSKDDAKKLVREHLLNDRYKIPLHNIEQAIYLYKIQNIYVNKDLNQSLKLLKSSKTSLDKLEFINEKKLMDYLYKEINLRAGRLDNLQYYMLERSMKFEIKKVVIKTLTKIEKNHEGINREHEIIRISNMEKVKNIFLYKKLGELYSDTYPNYQIYVDAINTLNNIIGRGLQLLENCEIEGYIQKKDILDEISIFPRLLNTTSYRNDYKMRKDFYKDQYQAYNKLVSLSKNEQYSKEIIEVTNKTYEDIRDVILLEWNKRR